MEWRPRALEGVGVSTVCAGAATAGSGAATSRVGVATVGVGTATEGVGVASLRMYASLSRPSDLNGLAFD